MAGFRVVYSRGSFAFAIACVSLEQALARAISVSREAGVWHVQVEDENGRPAALTSGGIGMQRGPFCLSSPLRSASRLTMLPLPKAKRNAKDLPE